jgi:hypothetical protein
MSQQPFDDRRATDVHNLPVPDPTKLTTELVDRALGAFREVMEARLDAMDRATRLVADDVARYDSAAAERREHLREDFDRQTKALREYILSVIKNVGDIGLEKFAAIDTRFAERDTRTEQAAQESRISLDAALAAAKEAVSEQNKANTLAIGKSELATQKQIDAMVQLMATSNRSLEERITDLKTRLDRGEGSDKRSADTQQQANWSTGLFVTASLAVMAIVVGIAAIIVTIALRH